MGEQLEVPEALAGERLDRAVALLTGWTRREVQDLVESGAVLVDGERVAKSRKLEAGSVVEVLAEPEVAGLPAPDAGVDVVVRREDADIVVVAKPAGLVVHPGSGHADGTLVNGLLARYPEIADVGDPARPGIVHRLDRDTSGVLLVARTAAALEALARQFRERSIHKRYLAIVRGRVARASGTIDQPIGRHPVERKRMSVHGQRARAAVTRWQVVERFPEATLVRLAPETGRTHQIRVHLAALGHPVLGDKVYGRRRAGRAAPAAPACARQALHAEELRFAHPVSGDLVVVRAALPADLEEVLARLRRDARKPLKSRDPLDS